MKRCEVCARILMMRRVLCRRCGKQCRGGFRLEETRGSVAGSFYVQAEKAAQIYFAIIVRQVTTGGARQTGSEELHCNVTYSVVCKVLRVQQSPRYGSCASALGGPRGRLNVTPYRFSSPAPAPLEPSAPLESESLNGGGESIGGWMHTPTTLVDFFCSEKSQISVYGGKVWT